MGYEQCLRSEKDDGLLCTSTFRVFNSRKVSYQYRMDGERETLHWLGRNKVFTTFDVKGGHFQVELEPSCRPYIAVWTLI